jgi:hypothetical protein
MRDRLAYGSTSACWHASWPDDETGYLPQRERNESGWQTNQPPFTWI